MIVALLIVDLHIPASNSLKDKRRVVSGLIDRTKARFNVSVAEVGHQNNLKQAQIAVVYVGCTKAVVQGVLENVARQYDSRHDAEVIERVIEYLY